MSRSKHEEEVEREDGNERMSVSGQGALVNNSNEQVLVRPCYKYRPEDWPWVWSIRATDPTTDRPILDWRYAIMTSSSPSVALEKIREIETRQQEQTPPVPILYHVWLSDQYGCLNAERLRYELNITHILHLRGSIVSGCLPVHDYERLGIEYMELEADDIEGYPLLERHFDTARSFVEMASRRDGICVVCSEGGMNRSATIVAAICMLETKWDILKTIQIVRQQRGDDTFGGNESFQEQLVAFARLHDLLGPKPGTSQCNRIDTTKYSPPIESTRKPFLNWYNMVCNCGKC